MAIQKITAETSNAFLEFDADNLRLCSVRPKNAPGQEFIKFDESHPTFEIGCYDEENKYCLLSSKSAASVKVNSPSSGIYTAAFTNFADFAGKNLKDLKIECKVIAKTDGEFARFGISVDNPCGLKIADVQYPFVVCPYKLNGEPGTESVVVPHGYGSGKLLTGDLEFDGGTQNRMRIDSSRAWEFCPGEGSFEHYPGVMYSQFLAYYNDRAGLYFACNDTAANIKRFRILHRQPGMRLGIAHVGDWNINSSRTLEYEILIKTFTGDWYDAVDIYRDWSMKQSWFVPLTKKKNIPEWLTDSPAYITIRSVGKLDVGEINEKIEEFIPYEKCLPLLQNIADKINAPLCVVFMCWENAAPWVYPNCFPPVGGEESLKNAIAMIKEKGWRAGSFNSGTRWCYNQTSGGYDTKDGKEYLASVEAEKGYCKTADGEDWQENWDVGFRESYTGCLGTEKMRETSLEIVGRQIDWGMEALQHLDQNNGSATFPCFADNHGHPDMPGKWMHESMSGFVNDMHELAKEKGECNVVHSAESGLNEVCLPLFQQTELRVYPEDYGSGTIPIYQYLFHECVVLQGMMGFGPEPYHLVIKNATNFILGGIPGGVMTGDGTLLDKDTSNWALWEPKVGDSDDAFAVMRNTLSVRRNAGKEFLVFGRMMRPAEVTGIERVKWNYGERDNDYAAVFHSAWQSQDGRHAVILANWTKKEQRVKVRDARFDAERKLKLISQGEETSEESIANSPDGMDVRVPALGCVMITQV